MNRSRWNLLPRAPAEYLVNTSGLSSIMAQLLYNRGITEPSQLQLFIAGDSRLMGDPFLLPGIHQAVARIYRALLSAETIAIYGDFDVDGITSTAVLVQGLSALGGKTFPYIPHRVLEGHGLNIAALEEIKRQGASLIITVDCGTTDIPELEEARKMGLDVIVTDHHTPLNEAIPSVAVVNPKLSGSKYPFVELAGVGVAYKLLQAVLRSLGKSEQPEKMLDLVALGTVADVMPLIGENRYLVKQGLESLNALSRLGLREIVAQAGINTGNLNSENITWVIAPRLNASSRLEHAIYSYRLLTTESVAEARELAAWLEKTNTERQRLTADVLSKAREQVMAQGISSVQFASARDYAIGVAGLVASKLCEEFYRPAVVVEEGEETSSGSCRSIAEFNVVEALKQCSGILSRFGGHARAAGFTMPTKDLPRLKEQLRRIADAQLAGVDLRPRLNIDVEVRLPDLGGYTFQLLQQLAPFGMGNPVPAFLSRKVEILDCRTMGNGDHLRLKVKQGGTVWDAVAFRLGSCISQVSPWMDIVYNLEIDRWNGKETLRLNVLDFAQAE